MIFFIDNSPKVPSEPFVHAAEIQRVRTLLLDHPKDM
jgi:hypothetical protein